MADPFEEFEFKPLTEGLGFQKRKINNNTQDEKVGSQVLKTAELSKMDFASNDSSLKLTTPLPTPNSKSNIPPKAPDSLGAKSSVKKPEAKAVEELVRTFKKPVQLDKPFTEGTKKSHDQIQSWEFMPFLIDLLITAAVGLIGLIISLATTKVDFMASFQNPNTDIQFFIAIGVLFLGLGCLYMLVLRCFVGATIGEVVFDLQTGTTQDQESALFPFKVIARTLLVTITGIVLLPLASIIFGRDLAGEWTGTPLVRKV